MSYFPILYQDSALYDLRWSDTNRGTQYQVIDAATLAQYATAPETRTCGLEKASHGVDP